MATTNPFDLLEDVDNDDVSQLIAVQQQKKKQASAPVSDQPAKPAKLPSKPLPPAQAVREAKNEGGRGVGRSGGRGYGRGRGGGGGGFNRDVAGSENSSGYNNGYSGAYKPVEEGEAGKPSARPDFGGPRGGFRSGRRGRFSNGEAADGEHPRRLYDRRSGTGRGGDFKRDGGGRGNWGTPTEEITPDNEQTVTENENNVNAEKQLAEEDNSDAKKENPENEQEKEPEEKEMTLEEYEKVLEEKRKALLALKTDERKVYLDKDFEAMLQLSNKKENDDIFIKLGSEKDKRKDVLDKDEKVKKSVSINEFLKPADGGRYIGGRGRGRGRGSRGGYGGHIVNNVTAPSIADLGQFPSLGAK